ncbi:MAG: hypothetical protein ABIE74_11905 [Pseudomonadota bacterium]
MDRTSLGLSAIYNSIAVSFNSVQKKTPKRRVVSSGKNIISSYSCMQTSSSSIWSRLFSWSVFKVLLRRKIPKDTFTTGWVNKSPIGSIMVLNGCKPQQEQKPASKRLGSLYFVAQAYNKAIGEKDKSSKTCLPSTCEIDPNRIVILKTNEKKEFVTDTNAVKKLVAELNQLNLHHGIKKLINRHSYIVVARKQKGGESWIKYKKYLQDISYNYAATRKNVGPAIQGDEKIIQMNLRIKKYQEPRATTDVAQYYFSENPLVPKNSVAEEYKGESYLVKCLRASIEIRSVLDKAKQLVTELINISGSIMISPNENYRRLGMFQFRRANGSEYNVQGMLSDSKFSVRGFTEAQTSYKYIGTQLEGLTDKQACGLGKLREFLVKRLNDIFASSDLGFGDMYKKGDGNGTNWVKIGKGCADGTVLHVGKCIPEAQKNCIDAGAKWKWVDGKCKAQTPKAPVIRTKPRKAKCADLDMAKYKRGCISDDTKNKKKACEKKSRTNSRYSWVEQYRRNKRTKWLRVYKGACNYKAPTPDPRPDPRIEPKKKVPSPFDL